MFLEHNVVNPPQAATIMNNMKIGASSTSFAAVKTAFERNYACMNITCVQIGGLWYGANNRRRARGSQGSPGVSLLRDSSNKGAIKAKRKPKRIQGGGPQIKNPGGGP